MASLRRAPGLVPLAGLALGLALVPPAMREVLGHVVAAAPPVVPDLVEAELVRGAIHLHTTRRKPLALGLYIHGSSLHRRIIPRLELFGHLVRV